MDKLSLLYVAVQTHSWAIIIEVFKERESRFYHAHAILPAHFLSWLAAPLFCHFEFLHPFKKVGVFLWQKTVPFSDVSVCNYQNLRVIFMFLLVHLSSI